MHLRDLGIKGWKAPEGGFKHSQTGLMTILSPMNKLRREEPIPMCETEIQLQQMLQEEYDRKKYGSSALLKQALCTQARLQPTKATPAWPAAEGSSQHVQQCLPTAADIPYQLKKPVQVTPRSGTILDPYPDNEKRRCRQKTPKSFGAHRDVGTAAAADGLVLSGLPGQLGLGAELSPVAEAAESSVVVPQKLSKGVLNHAQWNFGDTPGYYHNDNGDLCWGVRDEGNDAAAVVPEPLPADLNPFDVDVDVDDLSLMRNCSPMASPFGTPRSVEVC